MRVTAAFWAATSSSLIVTGHYFLELVRVFFLHTSLAFLTHDSVRSRSLRLLWRQETSRLAAELGGPLRYSRQVLIDIKLEGRIREHVVADRVHGLDEQWGLSLVSVLSPQVVSEKQF